MKIVLIGFMGSGKTSVAGKLHKMLRLPVLEMDELVLRKTETKSMDEVFAKGGESLLREMEVAIAREHATVVDHIISTGAGVVLNEVVMNYLRACHGKVVFLKADFQTIVHRLLHDSSRPLFKNISEAQSLYHFRQPLYVKYADATIVVDNKSIEEIAEEVRVHIVAMLIRMAQGSYKIQSGTHAGTKLSTS